MNPTLADRIVAAPRLASPASARAQTREFDGFDALGAKARALILAVADYSPYLWSLLQEDKGRARRLMQQPPEASMDAMVAAIEAGRFGDEAAAMTALRRAKREAALLIGLADLGGVWNVVEATENLTRFADAAVGAALRFLVREAARAGRLAHDPDDADLERRCGLAVLALGKHGARELNYSSDVDLVLFYDAASPAVPAGAEPAPLYVRIARGLARLLQERTSDGYVVRVDLRLRPDPAANPIAMSTASAFAYYETLGQNWERAAMIKARPIAGDLALGRAFLQELTPFVWRKYFDYAAIADVHAMKRQIHAVKGHERVVAPGHDIKLGRGGIREIEFFVQTQQLIFGGRRPALRGSRTLDMLAALHREGWVGREAADELSSAYRFLRSVEHRLQMIGDEQTQRLPMEPAALARFAKFCGFAGFAEFERTLVRHMRDVEKHYARLFEDAPTLGADGGSLVFTGVGDDPETLATLRGLGFQRPEQATETIRGWHFGRRAAIRSTRAREVLTELTPGLVDAFARSGDPDAGLDAFDAALARMPAAVELLSILRSNGEVRQLFADLLGGAPRLAEIVTSRPHVLDAAIDPGRIAAIEDSLDEGRQARRLEAFLPQTGPFEATLDLARDFATEEKFLIGVRLLSGALAPEMAARAYSALAQGLIVTLLARVGAEFARDHGRIPGARVAALALGKLGSREMTAASDLDLIVIYDVAPDTGESDGARPLGPSVYFARLTQRLLTALTAPTQSGKLYDVDLRLRPSGRQGPLATAFSSFSAYQRETAEVWEHMALTRARVVAGDPGLGREIAETIADVLRRPRAKRKLGREVAAMRGLIAREKGNADPWDLKLARGGLIDVEFAAQFLALAYAAEHPELAAGGTRATIERAGALGLIGRDDAGALGEAHRLFTDVTQIARLALKPGLTPEAATSGVKRRLAAAAAEPDFSALAAALSDARARVVRAAQRIVGADDTG